MQTIWTAKDKLKPQPAPHGGAQPLTREDFLAAVTILGQQIANAIAGVRTEVRAARAVARSYPPGSIGALRPDVPLKLTGAEKTQRYRDRLKEQALATGGCLHKNFMRGCSSCQQKHAGECSKHGKKPCRICHRDRSDEEREALRLGGEIVNVSPVGRKPFSYVRWPRKEGHKHRGSCSRACHIEN